VPALTTEDGRAVDATAVADTINAQFSQAMNSDQPETQAPPKRPDKTPDTAAPKRRGRPPKSEQARTTAGPAAAAGGLDDAARAKGVAGWVQIGAGLTLAAGRATGNAALYADAVTIASAAPQLADACVQVAKNDARFAAALDKVCSSGPYAALVSVGVSVGLQCLRNHRPGLALPGTVSPEYLLATAREEATEDAAHAG
jgi:hypothetical protein